MSKIKVTCEVRVYPDHDPNNLNPPKETILVKSHWSYHRKVVLVIDGKEFIVFAEELDMALKNATNAH